MSMKKAKIYAVIGSLFLSLNVAYAADLVVWEDIGKAHGIEKAVAQFEKENNCKVILKDSDYVGHLTAYEKAVKDGSQIPDVLMLPADRVGSAAKDGLIAPLSFMKNEEQKISAIIYLCFYLSRKYLCSSTLNGNYGCLLQSGSYKVSF